jgi:hypothetical protein
MSRPERWFVAAQFRLAAPPPTGAQPARVAEPLAHAKEMGTRLTACGLPTDSWFKLWHVPFIASSGQRCDRCLQIVTSGRDVRPPAPSTPDMQ